MREARRRGWSCAILVARAALRAAQAGARVESVRSGGRCESRSKLTALGDTEAFAARDEPQRHGTVPEIVVFRGITRRLIGSIEAAVVDGAFRRPGDDAVVAHEGSAAGVLVCAGSFHICALLCALLVALLLPQRLVSCRDSCRLSTRGASRPGVN